MRENRTLIEDMITLSGNMLGNLLGARHEARAHMKERMNFLAKQLDLVSRNEFDAAFAMLAKAREMQEELNERLAVIEGKMNLSRTTKTKAKTKPFLPSVKNRNQRRARK
jgi:BMFP domain-containing protein YqiC